MNEVFVRNRFLLIAIIITAFMTIISSLYAFSYVYADESAESFVTSDVYIWIRPASGSSFWVEEQKTVQLYNPSLTTDENNCLSFIFTLKDSDIRNLAGDQSGYLSRLSVEIIEFSPSGSHPPNQESGECLSRAEFAFPEQIADEYECSLFSESADGIILGENSVTFKESRGLCIILEYESQTPQTATIILSKIGFDADSKTVTTTYTFSAYYYYVTDSDGGYIVTIKSNDVKSGFSSVYPSLEEYKSISWFTIWGLPAKSYHSDTLPTFYNLTVLASSAVEDLIAFNRSVGKHEGYSEGYTAGFHSGEESVNFSSLLSWVASVFGIFDLKIFGNITLGNLLFIPLVFAVIFFILKIVRG